MEQVPSLLMNNEELTDLKNVANAFNTFFLTISEQLNIQQVENGDAVLFLEDSFPGNFPSMTTIPITEAEIKSVIHFLKPKKSSGYDEITSKILKACASLISNPLIYILTTYLSHNSMVLGKGYLLQMLLSD
jgi:hypothetical protein